MSNTEILVNYVDYNELATIPSIAVRSLAAYRDDSNLPVSLDIQATSNISIAASNNVYVSFTGGLYLKDSDASSNHFMQFSSASNAAIITVPTNEIYLNSLHISDEDKKLFFDAGKENGVFFKDGVSFEKNIWAQQNYLSQGNLYSGTLNVWTNNPSLPDNSNVDQVGYGFRINTKDQLELVKFAQYKDNTTQVMKRVAVFGSSNVSSTNSNDVSYLVFDELTGMSMSNPSWTASNSPTLSASNVSLFGDTVFHGSLIPNADVVYDLGTPSKRFKDLYLSGSTIYLGEGSMSFGSNGIEIKGSNGDAVPLTADQIPGLDASKIVTGTLSIDVMPPGYAGGSGSGGGSVTNLSASVITSGTFHVDRIPSLNANKIGSGVFNDLRIPQLDASKIVSGVFEVDRIPELDGNKITSGVIHQDFIPELDANKITSGELYVNCIPPLDANKISFGVFSTDRIPELDANKINTGVLDIDRIPYLDTSKIGSGVFQVEFIPDLPASILQFGELSADRIPELNASKISDGTFDTARIPVLTSNQLPPISEISGKLLSTQLPAEALAVANGGTGCSNLIQSRLLVGNGTNAVSSANLVWDSTNTRLGVGTTTPTSALHVSGDITFTGFLYKNANLMFGSYGLFTYAYSATGFTGSNTVTPFTVSANMVNRISTSDGWNIIIQDNGMYLFHIQAIPTVAASGQVHIGLFGKVGSVTNSRRQVVSVSSTTANQVITGSFMMMSDSTNSQNSFLFFCQNSTNTTINFLGNSVENFRIMIQKIG